MTKERKTGQGTARRPSIAGSFILGAGTGKPKRVGTAGHYWSDEAETVFLDILGATCNVMRASEAAGFASKTAYSKRKTRPDFAQKWQEAIEQGYVRLEMALIRAANQALSGASDEETASISPEETADTTFPPVTVETALRILAQHQSRAEKGDGRRPGKFGPVRSLEEVQDNILAKVRAIKAARGDASA